MIVITGIGRCGTSVMARFFKAAGFRMGSLKWYDRMKAGYEAREVVSINQQLIRHFVKGEEINIYHAMGDMKDIPYDVVKDPQFLADPRIIKTWLQVRKRISVVLMTRDYNEIAESMMAHPEWSTPVYRLFPKMMAKKEQEFKEMLDQLNVPYVEISYPIKDFPQQLADIVTLPDNAKATWNLTYTT